MLAELRELKLTLTDRLRGLTSNVAGALPVISDNTWLGRHTYTRAAPRRSLREDVAPLTLSRTWWSMAVLDKT